MHDVNSIFEKLLRVTHDEAVVDKIGNFIARTDDREYFESVVKSLDGGKSHHELDEIDLAVDGGQNELIFNLILIAFCR